MLLGRKLHEVEVQSDPDIAVRETTESDLPDLARLWGDGEVMRFVGFPNGLDYDETALRDWLDAIRGDPTRRHFVLHAEGVGFCGELFYRLDTSGRAELDVKLVPEAQGRGLATAGLRWLIHRVFSSEPDARLVWTEPVAENERAQALYARCGLDPAARPGDLPDGQSYRALARERWEELR
jgi:RimJ/RimL family protein N-acetyltransferase